VLRIIVYPITLYLLSSSYIAEKFALDFHRLLSLLHGHLKRFQLRRALSQQFVQLQIRHRQLLGTKEKAKNQTSQRTAWEFYHRSDRNIQWHRSLSLRLFTDRIESRIVDAESCLGAQELQQLNVAVRKRIGGEIILDVQHTVHAACFQN
jgi:hypothetical protein